MTRRSNDFTLCGACGKKGARVVGFKANGRVWYPTRIECRYCKTWEPLSPAHGEFLEYGEAVTGPYTDEQRAADHRAADRWRERAAAWGNETKGA